jgi:HAMP domain-containing protein
MKIHRIRYKLLITLAIALSIGFSTIAFFYTQAVEKSIISEYQRTLHRLTDSVVMNIETIMKGNHAEIMPDFARRLKTLPGIIDFRIARIDGTEAYIDNKTIDAVNQRLGDISFPPRHEPVEVPEKVFSLDDPGVDQALRGQEAILVRSDGSGEAGGLVHFYDPIPFSAKCGGCHANEGPVRGILKLTTSMADAERDMMQARLQSLVVLIVSLALTMAITGYMLGRFVAKPIEDITSAMMQVTGGNFSVQLPSGRKDELGKMARSFNKMTSDLQRSYQQMKREQEKLYAVIQGAREAVVVTDASGQVVIVNDSAEELLGKSVERIGEEGIFKLFDDPVRFKALLNETDVAREPTL